MSDESVAFVAPGRIVVIAYDFPPNPSPQSLRAGQLVDGLITAGYTVHVLTQVLRPWWPRPRSPAHVSERLSIERLSHHSMHLAISNVRKQYHALVGRHARPIADAPQASAELRLNWKGKLASTVARIFDELRFPGESRSWLKGARDALERQLVDHRPDCVVISHEPCVGLMMSHLCEAAKVPWIAELGDPVCAVYTPRRWRRRARSLEMDVCRSANAIVVTSEATRSLLCRRHGVEPLKVKVLTQGYFPVAQSGELDAPIRRKDVLRLVYTGSFYSFRSPVQLIRAVGRNPNVELLVAAAPSTKFFDGPLPSNVRTAGQLTHEASLALQASADILVNIANRGLPQIPGKFFEYLGTPKPILHVSNGEGDEQAALLVRLGRGWVLEDDEDAISSELARLADAHKRGDLLARVRVSDADVKSYSWPAIANEFASLVDKVRHAHLAKIIK